MPHRTPNVSRFPYMTLFSLVGVPKMALTSQPSPSYTGISIKALHVRAERSNGSSRHTGKQRKRKAAGLYRSKYKVAEQTWTSLWFERVLTPCRLTSSNTHCALYQPICNCVNDPSTTIQYPQDPQYLEAKSSSKPKNVLSCGNLSTSNMHKLLRKIGSKIPNIVNRRTTKGN